MTVCLLHAGQIARGEWHAVPDSPFGGTQANGSPIVRSKGSSWIRAIPRVVNGLGSFSLERGLRASRRQVLSPDCSCVLCSFGAHFSVLCPECAQLLSTEGINKRPALSCVQDPRAQFQFKVKKNFLTEVPTWGAISGDMSLRGEGTWDSGWLDQRAPSICHSLHESGLLGGGESGGGEGWDKPVLIQGGREPAAL